MTTKQAQTFLEKRRAELRHALGLEVAPETGSHGDEADEVAFRELRVIAFATQEHRQATLRAIDEALDRIHAGTYGRCTTCQQAIPAKRLEAIPWTPTCTECQVAAEQQRASVDRPALRTRASEQPGDNDDALVRRDVTPEDQALSELKSTDEAEGCR